MAKVYINTTRRAWLAIFAPKEVKERDKETGEKGTEDKPGRMWCWFYALWQGLCCA
jgi:hypothetical protein